jgi:hypothetical protein
MRVLIALPVVAALAWTPALAEDPKQPPEDKIVCKRNETYMTGSRLSRPKKTCLKASEWKLMEEEKDRTMRRVQDGRVSPDQPGTMGGGPG